jgi:hypothetical protein
MRALSIALLLAGFAVVSGAAPFQRTRMNGPGIVNTRRTGTQKSITWRWMLRRILNGEPLAPRPS